VVPTDTVYGLAAALDAPAGVAALYHRKGRPRSQPCQVLVYSPARREEALGALGARVRAAAEALLPGPATCLVPDPRGRFAAAAGDRPGSVGLRAPAVAGPLASLDLFLVATSANHPGGPDPASLDEVPEDLRAGIAALDAGRLPGIASAVVDLRPLETGAPAVLVRPGPDPDGVARILQDSTGVEVVRPG
jgi:L-threonylcarbamoyladenylate synthase